MSDWCFRSVLNVKAQSRCDIVFRGILVLLSHLKLWLIHYSNWNILSLSADYNFSYTRFHWSNNADAKIWHIISNVNNYLILVFYPMYCTAWMLALCSFFFYFFRAVFRFLLSVEYTPKDSIMLVTVQANLKVDRGPFWNSKSDSSILR